MINPMVNDIAVNMKKGYSHGLGKGMECGIDKDLRELNERYTKTRLESAWGRVNRVFEFKWKFWLVVK